MYRVSDTRISATPPRTSPRPRRARPITALAKDYPAGWRVPRHRHLRGQVVYAASGVMRVDARQGIWIVPPQRAVWVPAGMMHEVRMEGDVAMRTLYLDREASAPLGAECKVLFVSTLLRELILEMVRASHAGERSERMALMTSLLLDELRRAEQTPVHIPAPSDVRLKKVCKRLLDDASRTETLEQLAHHAGASSRTLARLFERELKMTFIEWRQHVRLARAISQMAVGDSIKKAAREAGYDSGSAFTAMFRRVLGTTPTRYLRHSFGAARETQ
jgi:AraC-like DNA-binding protein